MTGTEGAPAAVVLIRLHTAAIRRGAMDTGSNDCSVLIFIFKMRVLSKAGMNNTQFGTKSRDSSGKGFPKWAHDN